MCERGAAIGERALGLLERQHARARDVFLLQVDHHQGLDDRRIDVGANVDDGAHARAPSCLHSTDGRVTGRIAERSRMPGTCQRPFRADHDVGIDADGDCLRVRSRVEHDLDVVEVGEIEFLPALERLEAETSPEIEQPLLRMAIDPAVPLGTAEFDACAHDLEREARLAKFPPHREALDLCEIGEIADAKATRRLVADIADQVGRGKIVSVEFFVVRAFLFRHVDGASNRRDPHDVFERPGDRHRKVAVIATAAVAIIKRAVVGVAIGAAIHMQMRRGFVPESRTPLKADRFQYSLAICRHGTRIGIDVAVLRRGELFEHQGNRSGERPARMAGPKIDRGGFLALRRQHRRIGIAGVERSVDQPLGSFLIEQQEREKAFGRSPLRAVFAATRDRPKRIRIVRYHTVNDVRRGQLRNLAPGPHQQRGDLVLSGIIDHQSPGETFRTQSGERVAGRFLRSGDQLSRASKPNIVGGHGNLGVVGKRRL